MLKEFIEDRKLRLQDHPANVLIVVVAALLIIIANAWGLILSIICTLVYGGQESEADIYALLPETKEERKRRFLSFAFIEMALLAILVTADMVIIHRYNPACVATNIPVLILVEVGYFIFLIHNVYARICKNRIVEDYSREQIELYKASNFGKRLYYISVYLADKLLIIQILLCGIDIVAKGVFFQWTAGSVVAIKTGFVIGSVISIIDMYVIGERG